MNEMSSEKYIAYNIAGLLFLSIAGLAAMVAFLF